MDTKRVCSEAGCGGVHVARGFCHQHYRAFLKSGGSRRTVQKHYGKTPEERFWIYTKREDRGCWEWTGYKNKKGYGVLNLRGERIMAHRMSYQMTAEIPEGLFVLHRCDNPGCVRPKHLFLGTKADNNADMNAKGRRRNPGIKGTKNGSSKLTEDDVRAIRVSPETGVALAARFGVSTANISSIRARKLWAHID